MLRCPRGWAQDVPGRTGRALRYGVGVPFGPLDALVNALRGWPEVEVWYHPDYRIPLSSLEAMHGVEPRRADYVAWYLLERRLIRPEHLRQPERIGFGDLA